MVAHPRTETSPDAERVMFAIYRNMSAAQKLQLVLDANHTARELARAGLRDRHPDASSEELEDRLRRLLLGDELAEAAYGPPAYSGG